MAFVSARSRWSPLRPESAQFWRSGAIVIREDGLWELDRTHEVVRSAREAVRNRVAYMRRWAAMRPDTVAMEAHRQRIERDRTAHARELAAMRRVLVHAFPAARPRAVALVDVGARGVTTFLGDEITPALQRLSEYDIIAAVGVRALLRELRIDPDQRRLAELGPPQKTRQLNRRGRTLTVTTALLVQGSCGISHPFGAERTMRESFAAVRTPSSDAGSKQTPSHSTRFISTGVFTGVFVSAGASSTRCCPHRGFIETSPRCTTC